MILAIDTFPSERFGLVTGSRCSPLVPKKSAEAGQRTLAKQLANELFFKFYDERSTWQTEHGKMAEDFAHEHFAKYHDSNIERGRWIAKNHFGGSTDAESFTYGVDYKSPTSLEGWLDYMYDGVSTDQYNQCQLYMELTCKDTWVIAAFLMETLFMSDNGLIYPVPEKDRMILVEIKRDAEWVEKFYTNLPKVIAMRDEFFEMLNMKFNGVSSINTHSAVQ
jgi:hypothetical protein